jgi:hypothetical protein
VLLHSNIFFPFVVQFGPTFIPRLYNLSRCITLRLGHVTYTELGQHGCYRDSAMVWKTDESWFHSWHRQQIFLFKASRLGLGPTHPASCSMGTGDFFPRGKDTCPSVYFSICASSPLLAIFNISKHPNI